jgi:hypothetical protein
MASPDRIIAASAHSIDTCMPVDIECCFATCMKFMRVRTVGGAMMSTSTILSRLMGWSRPRHVDAPARPTARTAASVGRDGRAAPAIPHDTRAVRKRRRSPQGNSRRRSRSPRRAKDARPRAVENGCGPGVFCLRAACVVVQVAGVFCVCWGDLCRAVELS